MQRLDAFGVIRDAAEGSREIAGIAAPYGSVSNETELRPGSGIVVREALAPGSLAASVSKWMQRNDGAKMAFRPAHGEKPIGVVTELADTPEGVTFRASIFDTPAGDEYLTQVRAGLNGVSIEFAPDDKSSKRMRDGTILHRSARLAAIAGSVAPAYDGARIATRDMEVLMADKETPAPEPEPTPVPEPEPGPDEAIKQSDRLAAERSTAARYAGSAVITRPDAIYRRDSKFNYMQDHWLREKGDAEAGDRVRRHQLYLAEVSTAIEREAFNRALDPVLSERAGDVLSSEIPGAYPNDYLPGLLTPRIFKGRPMGDFYNRVPITDARPRIFPKVTTSTVVAVQSAEGAALSSTDLATTAVTTTPSMYGAYTDVSRQALDGGDPSVLAMVYQDLLEAYAQVSEAAIKTAVEAGSTASGVAITAATPYAGTLANVINYYAVRFRSATGAFIPSALFPVLAAQGDTTGRPFLPMIGAVNSDGRTLTDDLTLDLAVLTARAKLSYTSTVNVCVFGRPNDFVIFESSIAQFTYDQVVGPQAIRVGLWAYLGIGTRLGSLKVTAA